MPIPPQTPAEISVFVEKGAYVFRVGEARAIYTYDLDVSGRSNCYGRCARLYPPLIPQDAADVIGAWSTIKRTDGLQQWAYKRRPVYTYAEDLPGKALGDAMGGVWHIVAA